MIFFPLLFVGLGFLFVTFASPHRFFEEELNRVTTVSLRGWFAIEIMLGHLGLQTQSFFLFPFRKAGILFVGCFFALSGYGLICGAQKGATYFRSFLSKRCQSFLLPAVLVLAANYVVKLNWIPTVELLNWYVVEQAVFYLLFYLLYRYLPWKWANVLLFLTSAAFILIAYVCGLSNPWYGSTLCFPLGVLYAQFRPQARPVLEKAYLPCLVSSTIVLGVSLLLFMLLPEGTFLANVIARTIASCSFSFWTLLLLMKIQIGNPILQALGTISYEIYLLHPTIIALCASKLPAPIVLCAGVIVITLVFASVLHIMIHFLQRQLAVVQRHTR